MLSTLETILLSALVSLLTTYVGAYLNVGRLRRQERRIYGLALLAEVKSIQRSLRRYQLRVRGMEEDQVAVLRNVQAALSLWRHDLSVYTNNSGHIGRFSTRTAVELIEFYHRVRWLEARVGELDVDDPVAMRSWLATQQSAIQQVRHHSRYLGRLLSREIPPTTVEAIRAIRHYYLRFLARARLALKGLLPGR